MAIIPSSVADFLIWPGSYLTSLSPYKDNYTYPALKKVL